MDRFSLSFSKAKEDFSTLYTESEFGAFVIGVKREEEDQTNTILDLILGGEKEERGGKSRKDEFRDG